MADQIAARSIRASLAQTCLARIVQHRQGTGPDLCARYRLHRLVWAQRGATIEIAVPSSPSPRTRCGDWLSFDAAFANKAQMTKEAEAFDVAFNCFWLRKFVLGEGRTVTVAVLLRPSDWRPLDAPWWRGKQVSIIAADIEGNFFLRHSGGSVRFWDHQTQADELAAPSIIDFYRRLE